MAVVKHFDEEPQNSRIGHSECNGVIRKVIVDGVKYVQIDTYGSDQREFRGKLSQSLRLTEDAFRELRKIGDSHF